MDRTGDPETLRIEQLLQHEDWLRRLVSRLVRDPGTADDIVQQTWLAALGRESVVSVKAFLARVARNLAASSHRARERREGYERGAARAEELPSTAATLERLEAQQLVARAVFELPEPDRTSFLLRHIHGMSPTEIAERFEVPAGRVRQRCHRGMRRVRERLESELGPDWRSAPGILALLAPTVVTTGAASTAADAGSVAKTATVSTSPLLLTGVLMTSMRSAVLVTAVLLAAATAYFVWPSEALSPAEVESDRALAAERSSVTDTEPADVEVAETLRTRVDDAVGDDAPTLDVPAVPRAAVEVYRPDGEPVSGCMLLHSSGENPGRSVQGVQLSGGDLHELGATGVDGTLMAVVPERSGYLVAAHDGHTMVYTASFGGRMADDSPAPRRVVIAPSVTFTGSVVADRGEPLDHVAITRERIPLTRFPLPLEDSIRVNGESARTDSAGAFALQDLPVGLARLRFDAGPLFRVEFVRIPSTSDDRARIVMQRVDADVRRVVGQVFERGGAPLAGIRVAMTGRGGVLTDDRGWYEFDLTGVDLADDTTMYASRAGTRPAIVEAVAARIAETGETRLDLTFGGPPSTLVGRLVEADGSAAPAGIEVYPWDEPNLAWSVTAEELSVARDRPSLQLGGPEVRAFGRTDAEGRFEVPGLADRGYRFRVYDAENRFSWITDEVRPAPGEVEIRLPPDRFRARISGRVVGRDGLPIAGAEIGLSIEVWRGRGSTNWQGYALGRTDDDGRFEFEDLPRPELSLSISGDGIVGTDYRVDPADPGTDLEISVSRRCFVRVELAADTEVSSFSLLDASGEPLSLTRKMAGASSSSTRERLREGRSPVVAASQDATTAVFFGADGKEIDRVSVRLVPNEVYVLRR